MKLFLLSAAAAAALVFASPAAFAKDQHGHGNHGGSHAAAAAKPHAAKPAAKSHAAKPAAKSRVAPAPKARAVRSHSAPKAATTWRAKNGMVKTTASPGAVYNNAMKNKAAKNNNRNNSNRHDNNRHDNNNRHGNNANNNQGHNSHHDFNRRNVTAQHHYRYRGSSWRWPSGYSYRRWTYGMTLPSLFWATNYWINDYSDYGLAYPPPGTVWVRYGSDAVLIDRDSGEILEVVYGQFY